MKNCSQERKPKPVSHSLKKHSQFAQATSPLSTQCQAQSEEDILCKNCAQESQDKPGLHSLKKHDQKAQATSPESTLSHTQSEDDISTIILFTRSSRQDCVKSNKHLRQTHITSTMLTVLCNAKSAEDTAQKTDH